MFWAGPNSVKLVFVPAQKFLKKSKFWSGPRVWLKKFGPTQNILGPVKGQGIRVLFETETINLPFAQCGRFDFLFHPEIHTEILTLNPTRILTF